MPLFVAIGILILLIAARTMGSGTNHWFLAAVGVSVCFEIAVFLFPAIAIRCPNCGAHWFWIAILKQRSDNWFN